MTARSISLATPCKMRPASGASSPTSPPASPAARRTRPWKSAYRAGSAIPIIAKAWRLAVADFVCQYGNCESFDTPILVSNKKRLERARFCCDLHAALYLMRDASVKDYDAMQEQF